MKIFPIDNINNKKISFKKEETDKTQNKNKFIDDELIDLALMCLIMTEMPEDEYLPEKLKPKQKTNNNNSFKKFSKIVFPILLFVIGIGFVSKVYSKIKNNIENKKN